MIEGMRNNYGLPKDKLQKIFERYKMCVYCQKKMKNHTKDNIRSDWYTIEHLNYLPPWNNPKSVVICCWSCNSSRGNKKLREWFETSYCLNNNVNISTVTKEVKNYIINVEDEE